MTDFDYDQAIEMLLTEIYAGADWSDANEEMLTHWRAARGEAAMGSWEWWSGMVDDESYSGSASTREGAIQQGKADHPGEEIEIIEARLWSDGVKGDECSHFAVTRNHEVIDEAATS
jgi:hypothetical protein